MVKINARHEKIVALVNERRFLSVSEISRLCGVSEMTIRRDLEKLDKKEMIKRTYGGAVSIPQRMLEEEGFLVIRGRSGARVAAPATKAEDSTHLRLVEELRTMLARFRQAGVTREELLEFVGRELDALDTRGTEN